MSTNTLWVESYRPKSLSGYIFQDETQKKIIEGWIAKRDIPNLLLSGIQGSGKTTLSKIIVNELEMDESDVMTINASDENSVDTIREKIKGFAESYAFSGFKIIRLEEMDYLSLNAQATLRNLMEEASDNCRFIGTCNYENKVIPALRSRMQQFFFKAPNLEAVYLNVADILIQENVQFEVDDLDKFIRAAYPDVRKIINMVQQHTFEGLLLPANAQNTADYKFQALDLLRASKLDDLKDLILQSVAPSEYEDVFRFIYENMMECPLMKKNPDESVIVIADYLDKHGRVAVPEINMSALFSSLKRIG